MANGDQNDFANRIRSLLPVGWFGDPGTTPLLDGILGGLAAAHASVYSWISYARLQIRISTATDQFLDAVAADYFGTAVSRLPGETDTAFRARIRADILQPRATRAALIQTLTALTGEPPLVFEPARPADTGAYGSPSLAYGSAGGYGNYSLPFQAFVTVYRPPVVGIPSISGYSGGPGGYGVGSIEYASAAQATGIADAAIYAAIESVRPAATIIWTQITNVPPTGGVLLDVDFVLDESSLS